jgi:hypothetical protein
VEALNRRKVAAAMGVSVGPVPHYLNPIYYFLPNSMAAAFASANLFTTLFEMLPTGVLLLAPCFEQEELVDFTLEALNPAGQRP